LLKRFVRSNEASINKLPARLAVDVRLERDPKSIQKLPKVTGKQYNEGGRVESTSRRRSSQAPVSQGSEGDITALQRSFSIINTIEIG
jgi:hypothetical protein